MATYSHQELDDAFRTFWRTGAVREDWDAWADLFTDGHAEIPDGPLIRGTQAAEEAGVGLGETLHALGQADGVPLRRLVHA